MRFSNLAHAGGTRSSNPLCSSRESVTNCVLRARSFILRSSRSGDECRDPASAAVDERTHEPSPGVGWRITPPIREARPPQTSPVASASAA